MAGTLENSPGVSFSSMRILGSFALVYLTKGKGRYQMSGQPPLDCRAGDLLVIFPEIAHGYGPEPGGEWNEIYVVFEGEVFDLWRRHGLLSTHRPILRPDPAVGSAGRLLEIVALSKGADPLGQLERVCRMQSLLASVVLPSDDTVGGAVSGAWPAWLIAAVECFEADARIPLEQVAREIGMGYESFRKKFRHRTGVSPARFRDRLIADLARKLIYEERLSNKVLADRLGFCDEFHFSRRFHQITGTTTREFRHGLSARMRGVQD